MNEGASILLITNLKRTAKSVVNFLRFNDDHSLQNGQECEAGWYDELYSQSEFYRRPYFKSDYYFLWSVIVDRVRRAGITRVLEIGCGSGQLAAYLMDQGVTHYHGLDFSATAVAMARGNAPSGTFEVADARFSDVFSRVEHQALICTEVLEHVEKDLEIVARFVPGTRCYCTVPSFPFASHVRFFKNAGEVRDRYSPFFDQLDVMTLRSSLSVEDRFYLLEGVRNARVMDAT